MVRFLAVALTLAIVPIAGAARHSPHAATTTVTADQLTAARNALVNANNLLYDQQAKMPAFTQTTAESLTADAMDQVRAVHAATVNSRLEIRGDAAAAMALLTNPPSGGNGALAPAVDQALLHDYQTVLDAIAP